MITLIFEYIGEKTLVHIDGKNVSFGNTAFGNQLVPIEGIRLDYNGVCREFPDLETRKDWREEAIKRFKDKINKMTNEKEISDYIIEDLKKFGYRPLSKQINGFRIQKLKDGQ